MLDFQIPRITSESVEEHRGSFVIEPLDRGFGYTFGNSLRRVLLSSLQGAAIKTVQIDGVLHEFSSVPGVREDVTNIILNIKEIALRIHSDGVKRMVRRVFRAVISQFCQCTGGDRFTQCWIVIAETRGEIDDALFGDSAISGRSVDGVGGETGKGHLIFRLY